MSKRSKRAEAVRRKIEKRAQKQAMRDQYKQWALEGRNRKSKRVVLRQRSERLVKDHKHPDGRCWNVGCRKCFPDGPRAPTSNTRVG